MMKVVYHPRVQADVNGILRYYNDLSPKLADDFWTELMEFISAAAESPTRFHLEKPHLRRVNLSRFPYHFLYRIVPGGIRITVVRHHKQHPKQGLGRL